MKSKPVVPRSEAVRDADEAIDHHLCFTLAKAFQAD